MEHTAGQFLWESLENVIDGLQSDRLADVFRFVSFRPGETYGPDSHLRIEINYVKKGACILHLDGSSVSFRAGEMMIIASRAEHTFEAGSSGATLVQLEFLPEVSRRFTSAAGPVPTPPFPPGTPLVKIVNNIRIMRCVRRIVNELETRGEYYHYLVVMYYAELLILIRRHMNAACLPLCSDPRLHRAISYLRLHYQSEITLGTLAAEAGISERYLRKLFMRHLQLSPFDFLSRLRVDKAVELLRNTDLSVKEIGFACGFRSPQYFSRVFKQHTGVPPREMGR